MNQNSDATVRELTPLVFQLRELVKAGSDVASLNYTQSSCGGEDTYE